MLKLDPGQLLFLYESVMTGTAIPFTTPTTTAGKNGCYAAAVAMTGSNNSKGGVVERFAAGLGDWFENNGETFGETVDWVLEARGEDAAALREELQSEGKGIVYKDENDEEEEEEDDDI